jgi:uncharacterized membrane protein
VRASVLSGIVVVAVLLGAWLRTNGAEQRWVWQDEVTTMLHVAGRTGADVDAARPRTFGELAATVREPAPGGIGRVTAALAAEDAQHPPLYYLAQRVWNDAGGSALGRRSLSILFGALAVLAIGWFGFVLGGARAGAFALAFAAVSPFLVLYGQQMREYGLWCALIAASSALTVVAARRGGAARWAAYAIASAAALWTSPLSILLAPAHAAYALYAGGPRRLLQWALAYAAALVAFAPWAAIVYAHRAQIAESNTWSATPYALSALVAKVAFTAASSFTDLAYAHKAGVAAGAVVLLAIVAAAVYLARTQRDAAVALGAIVVTTALLPFVIDVAAATHRTASSRYLCPLVVALVTGVACALARMPPRLGAVAAALLVVLGAASSALGTSSHVWWDNHGDSGLIGIEASLAQYGAPPVTFEHACAAALGLALIAAPGEKIRCRDVSGEPRAGWYVLAPSLAYAARARAAHLALVPVAVGHDVNDAARSFQRSQGSEDDPVLMRIERAR